MKMKELKDEIRSRKRPKVNVLLVAAALLVPFTLFMWRIFGTKETPQQEGAAGINFSVPEGREQQIESSKQKVVAKVRTEALQAQRLLTLGEGIGEAYGGYGHGSAQSGEEGAADAYEPEVAFDIFKTFEFHTANVKRLLTCSPEFSGNPPDAVPRGLAAGISFSCGHAH